MLGGSAKLINDNLISKLIAFSFGTLIGDVFLHILPHLLEGIKTCTIIGHIHESHSESHDGHDNHEHGAVGHSHSLEKLRFYFYILGGIVFFIFIDFLSIKVYSSNNDDDGH